MNTYQPEIDLERKKIALLQDKIAECERRIAMLESLGAKDQLDQLLESDIGAPPQPPAQQGMRLIPGETPSATQPRASISTRAPWPVGSLTDALAQPTKEKRKRIPEKWITIFHFIGEDGKTFRELEAFLTERAIDLSPGAARTALMNYRKEFGFIDNPRKGFYRTTEKLRQVLSAQEDESPATANSEAFERNPPPSQGPQL